MLELLLSTTLSAALMSDGAPDQAETVYDESFDSSNQTLLSMVFRMLPETLDAYDTPVEDGGRSSQMLSFVGREDLMLRQNPDAFTSPACPLIATDGLAAVATFTDDAQIIIVNEAHDQALHRLWIARLGEMLSADISLFAAETFNEQMLPMVNANTDPDYIPVWLGTYSAEPIFGRALRTLRAEGYEFVAYEQRRDQRDPEAVTPAQSIAVREENQALNFIAATLEQDPEARVLVHVGYSHLVERAFERDGEPSEWFAARLKSKTGIDPLTISQTHCGATEEAHVDFITGALVNGDEVLQAYGYPGGVDLLIGRPPMTLMNGRPQWRLEIGDQPVDAPESFSDWGERLIIEARARGASAESVPVERLMLYPGEDVPLLLPEGEWVLTAWTPEGRQGDPVEVSVPSAP